MSRAGGAARPRLAAIACGWLVCWAAAPEPRALARSVAKVSYGRAEVWATAVRLLRVNSNLPIREKDEGAGYVLFDFLDGGKTYRASLELVTPGGGAEGGGEGDTTEVVVSIPELPRRFEAQLLDRLTAKLLSQIVGARQQIKSGSRGTAWVHRNIDPNIGCYGAHRSNQLSFS